MMNFHFFQVFGSRNKANGSTECYCSILAISRNFRLHHGDLQRQDRNSDNKYDVCFKGNSPRTLNHQEYYILPPKITFLVLLVIYAITAVVAKLLLPLLLIMKFWLGLQVANICGRKQWISAP